MIIAEDQALLRTGLARLFADEGHAVVATLGDTTTLDAELAAHDVDLVVLDIRMPPTWTDEGIVTARLLKASRPALGVLLLSQHLEALAAVDLVSEPGFGYLLKDRVLDVADFLAAAERVAAGGSALDPQVVQALVRQRSDRPLASLSARERDVLALMAEGLTNTGIASRLTLSPRTVEAHVGHLMAKLGLSENDDTHRRVLAVLAYLRESDSPQRG
ncbi:MAG: response regulator transcription factor [Nocardioides sp.]